MIEENSYYGIAAISNSSLAKINPEQGGSPALFKKEILDREVEDKPSPSLENGKLVHKYVEDRDLFVISDFEKPTGMMAEWVERVFFNLPPTVTETNFIDYQDLILEVALDQRESAYKSMKEDTVLAKFWKEGIEYISYLFLEKKDTVIMTSSQRDMMDEIITSINKCPGAYKLLFQEPSFGELEKSYNEKVVFWKRDVKPGGTYSTVSMNMKALIDRFIVKEVSEKSILVKLVDFKTTGKQISKFKNSFEYYKYYRQLAFYKEAIMKFLEEEYKGYHIVFEYYIVAVETFGLYQCRLFKIEDAFIKKGKEEYECLLAQVAYHQASGQWERTKEEIENGFELIKIEENANR